jgi:hypothetical protein
MLHRGAVTLRILLALGGVAVIGCGLGDIFSTPGLEQVTLSYEGDTVVARGTTVPISVSVRVGGSLQPTPRLFVTSSDTTVATVSAGMDSLTGVRIGSDTLTVRLVGAIFADSAPTVLQAIRVRP